MSRIFIFLSCFIATTSLFAGKGLDRLMKGNDRYVHDLLEHPNRTSERRESLVSSQAPFAAIVGCSDSRVPPEIIFDQGVGDLFVVRVAGNVIGPIELSSVEYAVRNLGASVILVMGHKNCGAVKAVVEGQVSKIEPIAEIIEPAIKEVEVDHPKDLLNACIKTNAVRMKQILLKSPVVQKLIAEGKLEVSAAYYNLETGAVELLDPKKF